MVKKKKKRETSSPSFFLGSVAEDLVLCTLEAELKEIVFASPGRSSIINLTMAQPFQPRPRTEAELSKVRAHRCCRQIAILKGKGVLFLSCFSSSHFSDIISLH